MWKVHLLKSYTIQQEIHLFLHLQQNQNLYRVYLSSYEKKISAIPMKNVSVGGPFQTKQ